MELEAQLKKEEFNLMMIKGEHESKWDIAHKELDATIRQTEYFKTTIKQRERQIATLEKS